MRYVLITVLILSIAAYVQLRPSCSTHSNILERANAQMLAIDNDLYKIYALFKTIVPEEEVGGQSYKLAYHLPQFEGNFEVRVKHRLMGVLGHDPKVHECDYTYVDMRILPDFVDTHEGVWEFSSGYLTVEWPYRYDLVESEGGCNPAIDDTLVYLRKV